MVTSHAIVTYTHADMHHLNYSAESILYHYLQLYYYIIIAKRLACNR